MRNIKNHIIAAVSALAVSACSFLDPLPDGAYTDENYSKYPEIVKGYVFQAYNCLPDTYNSAEFLGLDACTEDIIYTDKSDAMRQLSVGGGQPAAYGLADVWAKDYKALNFVNMFLKDDLGLNTRYVLEPEDNANLQKYLQGDAYGLRAWFLFDLVRKFGGRTAEGDVLGVPIFTDPVDISVFDGGQITRATYDDCIKQILSDCENALKYLPKANRDFVVAPTSSNIGGAARYRGLDCIAVKALMAKVYLYWASPAFNPSGDKSRWENAAKLAKEVIDYKLNVEGKQSNGFNPVSPYYFTNHNDPEIIWTSNWASNPFENLFYPLGFGGKAEIAPTQNLVDAFGMANGYPVTDSRSGYDPAHPYANRDPRFYATIFHDGAKMLRGNDASDVMYTFNIKEGGQDAPGLQGTSLSGYYSKRFIYNLWNSYDKSIRTETTSIFFFGWKDMCLIFAEAANHVAGPLDTDKFGMSAKQALAYLRSRTTQDGVPGLGVNGDVYLDECAAGGESKFDTLVRNERHIETCMQGEHFFDLRRWNTPLQQINVAVKGVRISADGKMEYNVLETRNFPSLWLPLPYLEVRKCPGLVQNAGWENWN